jgi:hypothetical protein
VEADGEGLAARDAVDELIPGGVEYGREGVAVLVRLDMVGLVLLEQPTVGGDGRLEGGAVRVVLNPYHREAGQVDRQHWGRAQQCGEQQCTGDRGHEARSAGAPNVECSRTHGDSSFFIALSFQMPNSTERIAYLPSVVIEFLVAL